MKFNHLRIAGNSLREILESSINFFQFTIARSRLVYTGITKTDASGIGYSYLYTHARNVHFDP